MTKFRFALIVACVVWASSSRGAAINFHVSFNDPGGELTAAASLIESHVQAAGRLWADHLVGNADIEVVVRPSNAVPYAEGRSFTSSFVRNNGTFNVFEQGMAAEIRTGVDPNGADPDVDIEINPDYVYNELWFDPDPNARVEPVDINRTDAMSTFLHEFGHALGYAGWINGTTGTYPGDYQSTYDERTNFDGTNFYFNGPEAVAVYGSPVPLTYANVAHVANFDPRPGQDLLLDLMNGLVFYRGSRYQISPLNIAMLRDAGVPAIYQTGDYDLDRTVDDADFATWKAAFNSTTSPFVDGNRNGRVDAADFTVWRDHQGASFAAASAVPEPNALVLIAAAGTFGLAARSFDRRVVGRL
ncbi:MAG: hypothetical protein AB7G28_19825 [Pirellulales bacterium]